MMEKEELQLRHRLSELASLCFYRNIPVFSDFLSLREQEVFLRQSGDFPDISYTLEGCFPDAERKAACFLPKADRWACSGCEEENSAAMEARRFFKLIKIAPVSERFAKECTHRDFLGISLL